jgi:hypothetical protein
MTICNMRESTSQEKEVPMIQYFRDMDFNGQPGPLDHMVVSRGLQEAATTARVTGYCAVAHCTVLESSQPAAAVRLWDFCPVMMEIRDEDQDDETVYTGMRGVEHDLHHGSRGGQAPASRAAPTNRSPVCCIFGGKHCIVMI